MLYIHYCKNCHYLHLLSGHKQQCPKCTLRLVELKITYSEYGLMSHAKRESLLEDCSSEDNLKKLSTTYRLYKYSKWYKTLQKNGGTLPDFNPRKNNFNKD